MGAIEKIARYYQTESAQKTFDIVINNKNRHPIIGLPTAAGKSFVIALLIDLILSHDPRHNILVLCDSQEILDQDYEELEDYFGIDIGLYSAGLESYTIEKITVAGIQSIWRKKELFSHFDFVIIDECDSVNDEMKSMYRSFLDYLKDAIYIGATATPYGLKGGMLYETENALFTEMSVDYTRGEKFLELQEAGYLAQIFSKPTSIKFDEKKLKTLAGDFSLKSQSEQFDLEPITRAAMMETIFYGENFKRWLLFAIDINHAENISRILTEFGISNCVIHSKMTGDRSQILKESKQGKYRATINVDVLTKGYNDSKIDLVGLYFCTKSPRKHVQTAGRLLRVDPDIEYKLILDFGGNFMRMGALNEVRVKGITKEDNAGGGAPMMKECPNPKCRILNYLSAKICCNCFEEFPVTVKLKAKANIEAEVVNKSFVDTKKQKAGMVGWVDVDDVSYSRKSTLKNPDFVRVKYKCGLRVFYDCLYIRGGGYKTMMAKNWMEYRWLGEKHDLPKTVDEFIENEDLFMKATSIKVDTRDTFLKIVDCKFD